MKQGLNHRKKGWFNLLVLILALGLATPAMAWQEGDKLQLQFGVYTHWSSSPDHEGPPIMGSIEVIQPNDTIYGLSLINNSFGQFSQYAYIGKRYPLPGIYKHLQAKLSIGLIHGYKDPYEDKIPFNHYGIAPAFVPSIGIKKDRYAVDLVLLGGAAVMLTFSYDIID
jgi:hypothetical protein